MLIWKNSCIQITKGDSGEMPESVSRVSEKTLTKLISEF